MNIRILTTSSMMAISAVALMTGAAARADGPLPWNGPAAKEPFTEFEQMELAPVWDAAVDTGGPATPAVVTPGNPVAISWEGISQYTVAALGRNFIPPDTAGAVGKTQFMEVTNGAYAVFNKATGAQLSLSQDAAWWNAAGMTGTSNGDTRIMYNATANRWIVESFASSVSQIQIAISDTSDATGGWKSVKFTGFAGGTADYPTLALDSNAVYIGTNNFNAAGSFKGTTLNVIPIDSLFGAGAPTVTGMKSFVTAYPGTGVDRGYAIQGVNSSTPGSTGQIVTASLYYDPYLTYSVNGLTPTSATGATLGTDVYLTTDPYGVPGPAAQPSLLNPNVIDTSDTRISSSVYSANNRTYMVTTVDPGNGHSAIRYIVFDSTTHAVLDQGNIGDSTHDYYMGAIGVNAKGEVVISYDRSGSDPADGNISVMARMYVTTGAGKIIQKGAELLLHVSPTNDYHNGSIDGQVATGRQRWGDYAQVTVDPTNANGFYLIGQFAREPNNAANGHPGGTGGTRWGTWIAGLDMTGYVPEPASWAMMLAGFGIVGGAMRRQRRTVTVTA